jgi:hypothetical protein
VNSRYTLILLLIFIGLVAFAVTQRDAEPMQLGEGAPTPTPEDLLEINASDIEEVSVEGESGSYVLSRVSGGWEVDGDAAADEVDGLVTRLANPSVTRELPADRDPEIYGFAAPTLTVTLGTAVGDTYVILVGDEVPGGYDRYVRLVPGEGEGSDVRATRIVIISGGDIGRLVDWLGEPPFAPTATPEATATTEPGEEPGEEPDEEADEPSDDVDESDGGDDLDEGEGDG